MKKILMVIGLAITLLIQTVSFVTPIYATTNDGLIINQVYGGGNKNDTALSHDFIELYNNSDKDIDLDGYKILYKSTGKSAPNEGETIVLSGTLKSDTYYLIRCHENNMASTGHMIDAGDIEVELSIDNDKFSIALTYNDEIIDGVSVDEENPYCDLNILESGSISKQKSIKRIDGNFTTINYKECTDDFFDENKPHNSSYSEEKIYDKLLIAYVYGGNGKSDAPVSNSFVEIYNPNDYEVDLSNYSLQYSDGGTTWSKLDLSGTIGAYCSYLIDCGEAGTNATIQITDFDATFDGITVNNKGVKFAIIASHESLTVANPFDIDGEGTKVDGYIDMFGVAGNDDGDTIDGFETAYVAEQSKKKGFYRVNYEDTDNNAKDFEMVDFSKTTDILPRSSKDEAWTNEEDNQENATDKLLIAYVYGSKGKSDAPVSNSFVEIYNPNEYDIELTGNYSLQYATYGSSWTKLDLQGTIKAKSSFLINCGEANTTNPNVYITYFDQTFENVKINNKGVKFVIMGNTTLLDKEITNPFDIDGNGTKVDGYIDMFGVAGNETDTTNVEDSTIDGCETSTYGGADSGQSKQKGYRRVDYVDTDNNRNDFEMVDFRVDNPALPRSSKDGVYTGENEEFSGPIETILDISSLELPLGTIIEDLPLPETVTAFLGNGKRLYVNVTWSCIGTYDASKEDSYTFKATLDDSIENNVEEEITLIVTLKDNSNINSNIREIVLSPNDDLSSSMGFAWYSYSLSLNSVVHLSENEDMSNYVTYKGSQSYVNVDNTLSHKVLADNLDADTTYYYQVGDGTHFSDIYSFTTGVEDDEEFSFIYTSDAQVEEEEDGEEWSNTLSQALKTNSDASFIIHAGDQVATANNEEQWSYFLSPQDVLTQIALAPAVGNHDNDSTYSKHFMLSSLDDDLSGVDGGVYSFKNGNTLFVVLNTEEDLTAQIEWMKEEVEESDATWTIVVIHRAIYSSGESHYKDNLEMRETLSTVFDELDIDLVLQGHDHSYLRSKVMYNDKAVDETFDDDGYSINPQGTVYLDMAGAANDLSTLADSNDLVGDYVAVQLDSSENAMYSAIEIDENQLTITTYNTADNSIVDTYGIIKTDTIELETLVTSVQDMTNTNNYYTEETFSIFKIALTNAQTVLNNINATQDEIDNAFVTLQNAYNGLTVVSTSIDKEKLEALVESLQATTNTNNYYTEETFSIFKIALTNAQTVLNNINATQDEIDNALVTLQNAYSGLTVVSTSIDKEKLEALVESLQATTNTNNYYTEETFSIFETALTNAQTVLNNINATQDEIDNALVTLQNAYNGLSIPTINNPNTNPNEENIVVNSQSNNKLENTINTKVSTGDESMPGMFIVLAIGSAIGIYVGNKKRKSF